MDMFHKLRAYFERQSHFTEEEYAAMQSLFLPGTFKKGEFLLREGEIAKSGAFVTSGCLRSYTVDDKGKEHILQFSPDNWWTGNLDSYRNGTPSAYFIDAIEDTQVLLLDASSFQKLMEIPAFAAGFLGGIQKSAISKDRRIIASLSDTAEERYGDFLQKYPTIVQRVPQHMIASYLGISPETLSRIRKRMLRKN
jgi:CRP-like cAMP-binding protein